LQYGRFLLGKEDGSNPFFVFVIVVYTFYRSVPFSGFVAFLTLQIFSALPFVNRLVRFNMQQAIYIDISLFFISLVTAVFSFALSAMGATLNPDLIEFGQDAVFVLLLVTVTYCIGSSILGMEPNKVPFISQRVSDRMPSIDDFDVSLIDRQNRDKKKEDKDIDDK